LQAPGDDSEEHYTKACNVCYVRYYLVKLGTKVPSFLFFAYPGDTSISAIN
jgi:hypothetical protein